MADNNHKKVDLAKIKKELMDFIMEVDSNDDTKQTDRTKQYARAAQRVRSALYEDGRKAVRNRLALSSYGRYLSDVKKAARQGLGWHHSLTKSVEKLTLMAPELERELQNLLCEDAEMRRKAHTDLMTTIKGLMKGKGGRQYRELFTVSKNLKLDHEVVRQLAMNAIEKEEIRENAKDALAEKKGNSVWVNSNQIKRLIARNLHSEVFSHRAVALALCCGRRPVELLYQAEFKVIGDFTINFTGHAKKREGVDSVVESEIYTLIPAEEFVKAFDDFRQLEPVKALDKYQDMPAAQRNVEINRRTAKTLNTAAKRLLENEERMFKDTRAIWARMVYDLHFSTDDKWKSIDEDVFWREMLGHDENETQMHYKHIKLSHEELPEEPEEEGGAQVSTEERVKVLEVIGLMEAVSKRKALTKINDFVMASVKEESELVITQTFITKGLGANRKAIKDYLEILATNHPEIIGN